MTADDSTPTRLADALFHSPRYVTLKDLRTLAQQAYLAGKRDGWDERDGQWSEARGSRVVPPDQPLPSGRSSTVSTDDDLVARLRDLLRMRYSDDVEAADRIEQLSTSQKNLVEKVNDQFMRAANAEAKLQAVRDLRDNIFPNGALKKLDAILDGTEADA